MKEKEKDNSKVNLVLTKAQNKRIKILGTVALSIMILSVSIIFIFIQNIEIEEGKTEVYLKEIDELEWSLVNAIIEENIEKANMQSKRLKSEIEHRIVDDYGDNFELLKKDFDYPTEDAKFTILVNEVMDNVYLNINNDNNDPFLAFTELGVFSDKSLNCSSDGEQRSWEEEILKHSNVKLAEEAVKALINMENSKTIFWEFLPSTNTNHTQIDEMRISHLKDIFFKEGLRGLETYEFLSPSYITPDGDIFGTDDVNSFGYKLSNYKIIVVQGFNIVDAINQTKREELRRFEESRNLIIRECEYEINLTKITLFLILGIIFLTFISVISVYNNELDAIGDKNQEAS